MADSLINPSVVGEEHAREEVSPQRWWALAVLCLSIVVITIDTTILNVALPSLVRSLHASSSQLQWIVDAYTVAFASLLLTAGSLGDRFGRLGALNVGMAVFALGSVASALAASPAQLIVTRAVTGIGAAFVFPATLSLLTNIFPDPVERQRAIAIWAGASGIGIGLGPVAGGLLLRSFYWGSVFWVNVPVCLSALIAARVVVPSSRDPGRSPLDPPGAVLSVLGLSALVYAIIEGPAGGWTNAPVVAAFVAATVVLAGFVVTELRRNHPMLDVRLFSNPRFSAASLAITALFFCLTGVIFFQTQHLQFVLGYDALGAGLRSAPVALVLLLVSPSTPRFVRLVGTRAAVTTGLVTGAVAMAARAMFSVHSGYDPILITQCMLGLGVALTLAPATASIMGAVGRERAGVGSAVNDTTRQVGGALGVAVMGSVGASLYRQDLVHYLSGAHLPAAASAKTLNSVGAALQLAPRLPGSAGQELAAAARHAFIQGSNAASLVGAAVAAAVALLALRFLPPDMRVGAPAPAAKPTLTEHPAVDPVWSDVIQLT